jgi:predicted nucleotidyltransferase
VPGALWTVRRWAVIVEVVADVLGWDGATEVSITARRHREVLVERRSQILEVVSRYGGTSIRVVGSVSRGNATEGSDIDLLLDLPAGLSLLEMMRLRAELEAVLGAPVDLIDAAAVGRAGDFLAREAHVL